MAKIASRYGGVYATHMRNESNAIMSALDEAIRIGTEANIPVEIFHLKMAGKPNWGKMRDVIAKIEAARAHGLDITADQYPYVAGATSLGAALPPWSHEGGTAKFVERLKDPATREKLKQEMRAPSNTEEPSQIAWVRTPQSGTLPSRHSPSKKVHVCDQSAITCSRMLH